LIGNSNSKFVIGSHKTLPNIAIGLSPQPIVLGLRIHHYKELKSRVVITDAIKYV